MFPCFRIAVFMVSFVLISNHISEYRFNCNIFLQWFIQINVRRRIHRCSKPSLNLIGSTYIYTRICYNLHMFVNLYISHVDALSALTIIIIKHAIPPTDQHLTLFNIRNILYICIYRYIYIYMGVSITIYIYIWNEWSPFKPIERNLSV